MQFEKRVDFKDLITAGSLAASSQTVTLPLTRENWLESIIVRIAGTATVVTTPTANGYWNLLKRARLSVSDAVGQRQVLNVTGAALIGLQRQWIGSTDRKTAQFAPADDGSTVASAFEVYYYIPFRHPQLQEPMGASTMLALPRMSVDPVLELEIAASTDVAATFTTTASTLYVSAQINRRAVNVPNFPYIPTELITHEKLWPSTGQQDFEIPAGGIVTGILHQDFTSATARGSVLTTAASDYWAIEYLNTVIRRTRPHFIASENEMTLDVYPDPATNIFQHPLGELYHDFITDNPGSDAFVLGSALDLNPVAASGGKARIIGSSITGGAGIKSNFTVHKMFGDLREMVGV